MSGGLVQRSTSLCAVQALALALGHLCLTVAARYRRRHRCLDALGRRACARPGPPCTQLAAARACSAAGAGCRLLFLQGVSISEVSRNWRACRQLDQTQSMRG
jgi:hypothetical protein